MPNKISRFWQEVKRRNVHRSLAVYAGTSFMIFEACSIVFPHWGLPDRAADLVLCLLITGLVIVVGLILLNIFQYSHKSRNLQNLVKSIAMLPFEPEISDLDQDSGFRNLAVGTI